MYKKDALFLFLQISSATNDQEYEQAILDAEEIINLTGCLNLAMGHLESGQWGSLVTALRRFLVCNRVKSP